MKAQDEIWMMTYNIKLDYPKEGENSWQNRKDFLLNQISYNEPDIFGVQEALPNQMADLDNFLSDYKYIGVGRDDGKQAGEFSAIFFKKDVFKVVQNSTFWLSETPDKPSLGWDARFNRICTFALFKNKKTNILFWVFNTHLDHEGLLARKESLKLIKEKIKVLNTEKFPVILMGDFNLEPETEALKVINSNFNDSKEISKSNPFGPIGTFNGFEFKKPVTRRIDYIYVSKNINVKKYAILSDSNNCRYPSDHFPVLVKLCFQQ